LVKLAPEIASTRNGD